MNVLHESDMDKSAAAIFVWLRKRGEIKKQVKNLAFHAAGVAYFHPDGSNDH